MAETRSLSQLANKAIDGLSPVRRAWTNQDIADLVNATAVEMFAAGEIDKPVSVSPSWVHYLRKGERNGQPIEVGSRTLKVFARALGVPYGYFADGPQYAQVDAELTKLIELKANTGAMSVAHRLANLPETEQAAVLQALERAELNAKNS